MVLLLRAWRELPGRGPRACCVPGSPPPSGRGSPMCHLLCSQSASCSHCLPPPSSAQDTLGPGNLEDRGFGRENEEEKPLERHPLQTCFAGPGPEPRVPWAAGHFQLPNCCLAIPGAKKDASGKIPACESGLPRFLYVVHVRPAPGAGTPKFWSAALLRL